METRQSIVTEKRTQLDWMKSQKETVFQPDLIKTMQNVPIVVAIRHYVLKCLVITGQSIRNNI